LVSLVRHFHTLFVLRMRSVSLADLPSRLGAHVRCHVLSLFDITCRKSLVRCVSMSLVLSVIIDSGRQYLIGLVSTMLVSLLLIMLEHDLLG